MAENEKFQSVLSRLQGRYDSDAQAAEDLADGIIAAGSTDEIMQVIQRVGDSVDGDSQGLVLATAYALVAKRT